MWSIMDRRHLKIYGKTISRLQLQIGINVCSAILKHPQGLLSYAKYFAKKYILQIIISVIIIIIIIFRMSSEKISVWIFLKMITT